MQNDEQKPIPSPLFGGEFMAYSNPIHDQDVEELCKKYGSTAGLIILFKKEDVPCCESCTGTHGFGADFNVSHNEAHVAVEMIIKTFKLDQCDTD